MKKKAYNQLSNSEQAVDGKAMKYIKIISMAVLALVFYSQGIFSENVIFIWSGHISVIITVVYGYIKLFRSKDFSHSTAGRKAYGIFDLIITLGAFLFSVSHLLF